MISYKIINYEIKTHLLRPQLQSETNLVSIQIVEKLLENILCRRTNGGINKNLGHLTLFDNIIFFCRFHAGENF